MTCFGKWNVNRYDGNYDWVKVFGAVARFPSGSIPSLPLQLLVLVKGLLQSRFPQEEAIRTTHSQLTADMQHEWGEKKNLCCWKPVKLGAWLLLRHSLAEADWQRMWTHLSQWKRTNSGTCRAATQQISPLPSTGWCAAGKLSIEPNQESWARGEPWTQIYLKPILLPPDDGQ